MVKSMTGYGSAKGIAEGLELSIELKSVNNRFLDTAVRMPRTYMFAEEDVKSAVQRHITRGKVDVFPLTPPKRMTLWLKSMNLC